MHCLFLELATLFLRLHLKDSLDNTMPSVHCSRERRRVSEVQSLISTSRLLGFVAYFAQLNLPLIKRNEMWLLFEYRRKKKKKNLTLTQYSAPKTFFSFFWFFVLTFQVKWLSPLPGSSTGSQLFSVASVLADVTQGGLRCTHAEFDSVTFGSQDPTADSLLRQYQIRARCGSLFTLWVSPIASAVCPNGQWTEF